MKSMPVIGTYMSFFLFGGEFPGDGDHPAPLHRPRAADPGHPARLIAAHMVLLVYHKHTQWPGPGRTNDNVVGYPMLPVYAAKAGGFFFIVFGVTALMGGLMSINPVWKYGPYDPSKVTAGSQPDWYMGWPDGALRIMPGWETHLGGFTVSWNILLPIIVLPGLAFKILLMLPIVKPWITGDEREHHLLQRPRNGRHVPAGMVALMTFYGLMWAAGGNDIIGDRRFDVSINQITYFMRAAVFVGPGDRLRDHPALVHLASAQRPRAAAARLRERHHHALGRGRLLRAAPAAQRGAGLHGSPRATGTRSTPVRVRRRRQRSRGAGLAISAASGQAVDA